MFLTQEMGTLGDEPELQLGSILSLNRQCGRAPPVHSDVKQLDFARKRGNLGRNCQNQHWMNPAVYFVLGLQQIR